jgi:hypothetical protein
MNKAKVQEALRVIADELSSDESINTDMAIYQVYAEANSFIAKEVKRIAKEEGKVMYVHPKIAPLYKFFDAILPVLKKYSSTVREREEAHEQKINVL